LALMHGMAVEFMQDEGCVGLLEPVIMALLQAVQNLDGSLKIPIMQRTDPAWWRHMASENNANKQSATAMEEDNNKHNSNNDNDDNMEKTPSHMAWGAFDVPDITFHSPTQSATHTETFCTILQTPRSVQHMQW